MTKHYKRREFLKALGAIGGTAVAGMIASKLAQAYSIPQVEKIYSPEHPDFAPDIIIYMDGSYVVAEDKKGNTLAKSTDGAQVLKSVIENYDGIILMKQIMSEAFPMKLRDGQTIILDRCKLTLKAGSNDSMFKIYDVRAKIISLFSELDGNKANQSAEPSSGIRILANAGEYAEAEIEGILYIHDFLSQGIDVVATSTSRSVARLNGIIKTYNNGRNGIYVGYNGEVYHNGYLETYGNGSVGEGDGVTLGDIGNKVVLDKVYAHDNARAGVSIWRTNYTKINHLEAYNNETHGLYIETPAHSIFVDSFVAYNNTLDGLFIAHDPTLCPLGTKKNVMIRGIARNNSRRGVTVSLAGDVESIILDIISHDNVNEGFYAYHTTYKVKNSRIKIVSLNNGASDVFQAIDESTSLVTTTTRTVKVDIGDFGGGFVNYTPSPAIEGSVIIAIDTNASAPGKRLYVYANGQWHYVDLT